MIGRNLTGQSGWAVLYRRREVPSLSQIEEGLANAFAGGVDVLVTSQSNPHGDGAGAQALECVTSGLSFDLEPIAPSGSARHIEHGFGVDVDDLPVRSGLSILASPHIGSVADTLPVIRTGASLAADVSRIGDPLAVVWTPIQSAMEPRYFRQAIASWLDGGSFPALGLTAFRKAPDGGLHSRGLSLFTGQEVRLAPEIAARGANALKIGARVIDRLVEAEPVERETVIALETGERIQLSVSRNRRFVIVSTEG